MESIPTLSEETMKKLLLIGSILFFVIPYSYSNDFSEKGYDSSLAQSQNDQSSSINNLQALRMRKEVLIQEEYQRIVQQNSEYLQKDPIVLAQYIEKNLDKITLNDKFKIADILLSKYSLEELKQFREMALDGLDENEQQHLLSEVYRRFSVEEIKTMIEISEKYLDTFLAHS